MPFFKRPDGGLHFLSDDDVARGGFSLLPIGCVEVPDAEVFEMREASQVEDQIKWQIAELEAFVTPRRIREAVLGTDGGWLAGIDRQIADLRAQL